MNGQINNFIVQAFLEKLIVHNLVNKFAEYSSMPSQKPSIPPYPVSVHSCKISFNPVLTFYIFPPK
jgi:hypothetical protein